MKCDEPYSWYAKDVGEIFDVFEEGRDCYYIDNPTHAARFVLKEDCEVLKQAGE